MERIQLSPVLGPDGQPEAYQWAVFDRAGGPPLTESTPDGVGHTFSVDVDPAAVRDLVLVPQRAGLRDVRLAVPDGCRAFFTRRRVRLAEVGGADVPAPGWTGLGWRDAAGNGPTLWLSDLGRLVVAADPAGETP